MQRRRGSLFLEVTMAVTLLAFAFIAVAQLLAVAAKQRRETDWRVMATREAANVLEQIMARPWEEITTEKLAEIELSAEAAARLPEAQLSVAVDESDGTPAEKKVRVEIDWKDLGGLRVEPIRLVAWKHRAAGAE